MSIREQLRQYLFGTLMPMPATSWPKDHVDLMDLGLDSLRVMQLLVFIEEQLGVNLPDQEVTPERISTVDALVSWIGEHQRA